MRILVTTPYLQDDAMAILRQATDEIEVLPFPNTDEAVHKAILDYDPHGILSRTFRIGAETMQAAPSLKVISKHGVGVDNIDLDGAAAHGIIVTNCFGANAPAVAEHTFAMIMALAKNLAFHDRRMQRGEWSRFDRQSEKLEGRTLGLIGYGQVAQHLSRMVRGFDLPVIAYSPRLRPGDVPEGVRVAPLDTVLAEADIVSLHCPLNDATRHLIDVAALARMQDHAWLINTARGSVVDEAALIATLQAGQIGGAGLDCFETEPLEADNPLQQMDNVVVTPHCAGGNADTRRRVGRMAAQNLVDILAGRPIEPRAIVVGENPA